MAALTTTRQALLVNVMTGVEFPLAHGENIIGRSSSRQQPEDDKKLPLNISPSDGNISRHQGTIAVANHSDGLNITLQTHRSAKNPTKLCRGERFGTGKRARVTLKPGEIMKLSQGDLIELDSLREGCSSYAWRLDVQGAMSSSDGRGVQEAGVSHFNAFKGRLGADEEEEEGGGGGVGKGGSGVNFNNEGVQSEDRESDNDVQSESSVEGVAAGDADESDDEELLALLRSEDGDGGGGGNEHNTD